MDELHTDTRDVADALATLTPPRLPEPGEVAVARERLEWRRRAQLDQAPQSRTRFSTPWRVAAGAIAAAMVVTCVVAFTPEGNSAAAAFLAQFRSQQVSAVELTPQSQADIVRALNSLSNLGTVQGLNAVNARPQDLARAEAAQARTVTVAEAAQTVGFALLTPDPKTLPTGMSNTPSVRVSSASEFRFTFDKNKARTYYQSTGHPEVSLPDKFDGASLIVTIPSAAILNYRADSNASRQDVIVAEAGELVVDVQGNVSLPEMRDFLLSLPGLPPAVVSQLKQIQNWNNTLPIPVPVDQVNWQSATINGSQGLLLDDNSGIGSAAVWHANGHLYGVAGSLKATNLKKIADSLAVR